MDYKEWVESEDTVNKLLQLVNLKIITIDDAIKRIKNTNNKQLLYQLLTKIIEVTDEEIRIKLKKEIENLNTISRDDVNKKLLEKNLLRKLLDSLYNNVDYINENLSIFQNLFTDDENVNLNFKSIFDYNDTPKELSIYNSGLAYGSTFTFVDRMVQLGIFSYDYAFKQIIKMNNVHFILYAAYYRSFQNIAPLVEALKDHLTKRNYSKKEKKDLEFVITTHDITFESLNYWLKHDVRFIEHHKQEYQKLFADNRIEVPKDTQRILN